MRMVRILGEYNPLVGSYLNRRRDQFSTDPRYPQWFDAGKSAVKWQSWRGLWDRSWEALPWVAGGCFALSLIAWVTGWIARGFAGVPHGQDFRKKENR